MWQWNDASGNQCRIPELGMKEWWDENCFPMKFLEWNCCSCLHWQWTLASELTKNPISLLRGAVINTLLPFLNVSNGKGFRMFADAEDWLHSTPRLVIWLNPVSQDLQKLGCKIFKVQDMQNARATAATNRCGQFLIPASDDLKLQTLYLRNLHHKSSNF